MCPIRSMSGVHNWYILLCEQFIPSRSELRDRREQLRLVRVNKRAFISEKTVGGTVENGSFLAFLPREVSDFDWLFLNRIWQTVISRQSS